MKYECKSSAAYRSILEIVYKQTNKTPTTIKDFSNYITNGVDKNKVIKYNSYKL